jgi:hypothetical protein
MNNSPDIKSKRARVLKVVAYIILTILVIELGGCSIFDGKGKEVQRGMAVYLQEKYGMEFEVEMPYVIGDYSLAHYQAKAHPKGQSQPEFLVNDRSSLDEAGFIGKYDDYYMEKKWNYQGRMEIEKKIREIYGETADFTVRYGFGGGSYALKDLDYTQVVEIGKSRGNNGTSDLSCDVFMDGAQFNKEAEAEKAYKLLKPLIFDLGNRYNVYILYIDKSDKDDYQKNSKLYHDKTYNHEYLANKDKKILGYFRISCSPEKTSIINSGSDIIKFSE